MGITNKNIGVEESSTITAKVATVQIARGSTNEQQEILVLGDPQTSNALAVITDTTPASTAFGLVTREAAPSTGPFAISSIAGITKVGPSDTNWASSAGFHFNSSGELNVNVASPSTIITISTVQGQVIVRPSDTNWASSAGFHFNSSGELQTVAAVTPSTTVNVSSLAGRVTVAPSDTNFASSAGFHFDSSGALQIKDVTAPSTGPIVISSITGLTRIAPNDTAWASSAGFHFNSSGDLKVEAAFSGSTDVRVNNVTVSTGVQNSSAYLAVRFTDGTAFVETSADYTDASTTSTLIGPGLCYNNGSNATMRLVGITQPLPMQVTDSSNAGVKPGDSANNAIRVNVVAGAAGGSTDISIHGVTVSTFVQNSSAYLPVRISDGSSAWVAMGVQYTDGSTVSTKVGGAVFFDNGSNTTMRMVSSAAPLPVAIVAGTAAGSTDVSVHGVTVSTFVQNSSAYLAVRITDGSAFVASSVVTVSTIQGQVIVRPSDTNFASSAGFHFDSSGALQIKDVTTVSTGPFAISSIAGVTKVTPNDTSWASSAGFHFDSSGALQIVGSFSASTTVQVSSVGGVVAVSVADGANITQGHSTDVVWDGTSSNPSLVALTKALAGPALDGLGGIYVRVNDATGTGTLSVSASGAALVTGTVLSRVTDPTNSTQQAAVLNAAPASTVWALAVRTVGGTASTDVTAKQGVGNSSGADAWPTATVDSSNAIVKPGDSANNALRVNVVAGAAAGSTDVSIHGITVSTFVQNSSAYLPVRISDGSSAWVPFAVEYTDGSTVSTLVGQAIVFNNSSGNTMRMVSATTPLPVLISTGAYAISSIAGVSIVRPEAGSTFNVRPLQSSQADLRMTAYQSSRSELLNTVYQSSASELLMTATLGTNLQSTAAGSSNSSALLVRPIQDTILSTASTNVFGGGASGSTIWTIQSSGAALRTYVTAYSITSTVAGSRQIAFYSSGTMIWPLVLQAPSSAICGVNLVAGGANSYIFRTAASEALSLQTNGSTESGWVAGISFYRAP